MAGLYNNFYVWSRAIKHLFVVLLVALTGCGPANYLRDSVNTSTDDSDLHLFQVAIGTINNSNPKIASHFGVSVSYRSKRAEDLHYTWSDAFQAKVTSLDNFGLEKLRADGSVEKDIPFQNAEPDIIWYDLKKLATDLYLNSDADLEKGSYRLVIKDITLGDEKINGQEVYFDWPQAPDGRATGLSNSVRIFFDDATHY